MVVEGDDVLGWPRQVGDDEADPRAQLAGMPLDLAHDAPRFLPALRLIGEAGIIPAHLKRRSTHRALGDRMRRLDCVIIPDRNYSLTKYLADADGGSKRILLLIGAR